MVNSQPSDQPGRRDLRRRVACELGVLAVATIAYLLWGPRTAWAYLTLAGLFAGYVFIDSRRHAADYWDVVQTPVGPRYRTASLQLGALTVIVVATIVFVSSPNWRGINYPSLLVAVALYALWAYLQQYIFQIYLHGRLRVLFTGGSPTVPAMITGFCYALVHAPEWRIVALTAVAGPVWSVVYSRQRVLVPLAVSHALVGTTYYYLIAGRDLLDEIIDFLAVR